MKQVIRQFTMASVTYAVMQVASAQVAITNVVPMTIPGQGTEVRIMFNGLPPQPQSYQLEQPSRLILDFDQATQKLAKRSIALTSNEASGIEVSADEKRARVTVNLKNSGAFTTRVEGNVFILKINNLVSAATPLAAPAPKTSFLLEILDFKKEHKVKDRW